MKTRLKPWLKHLPAVAGVVLLIAAIVVTRREFRHLDLRQIHVALSGMPRMVAVRAFGFAIANYLVLTLYDTLANYWVGSRVAYPKIAFTSFCAYALSHNLGFSTLSGAAVRYRLYANFGLTPLQIAKVTAFCSLSFGLGGMVLGGAILVIDPASLPFFGEKMPLWALRLVGLLLWGVMATYIVASRVARTQRFFGHRVELPGIKIAAAQVVVAACDVMLAASIIFWLLPPAPGLDFWGFLAIYLACYCAGLITNLPGGIGVFDSAMLIALSRLMPVPVAATAILIFRLYYYIIPLFVAGLLFAGNEALVRGRNLLHRPGGARFSEPDFAAAAITGIVVLCGVLLLSLPLLGLQPPDYSFVDPAFNSFVAQAGQYVPSLMGTAFLVLAMGLSRRVRLAWWLTMAMLLAASGFTAAQGLTPWLPVLLALAALVVAPFRSGFYRRSSLLSGTLDGATSFSLLVFMLCVLALAAFVPTVRDLSATSWWDVVLARALPAPIRVSMALAMVLALTASWRLIRPGDVRILPWDSLSRRQYQAFGGVPPEQAEGVVLGESGRAMLPVRRVGEILLGLGDPVGAHDDLVSAVWRFRDLARQEGRDPAMWRVGSKLLHVYGDLGMNAVPLGDDGLVSREAEIAIDHPHFYVCAIKERDFHLLRPLLAESAAPQG